MSYTGSCGSQAHETRLEHLSGAQPTPLPVVPPTLSCMRYLRSEEERRRFHAGLVKLTVLKMDWPVPWVRRQAMGYLAGLTALQRLWVDKALDVSELGALQPLEGLASLKQLRLSIKPFTDDLVASSSLASLERLPLEKGRSVYTMYR